MPAPRTAPKALVLSKELPLKPAWLGDGPWYKPHVLQSQKCFSLNPSATDFLATKWVTYFTS